MNTVKRNRARTAEEKAQLCDEILDASVKLYAEVGYEGFSMRKLAARLNATTTMIYHYYPDKNSILEAVLDKNIDDFLAAMHSDKTDLIDRMEDIGKKYIRYGYQYPEQYKLMYVQRPNFLLEQNPELRIQRRSILTELQKAVAANTDISHTNIESSALTDAMWAQAHGLVTLSLSQDDFTEERALASLSALMTLIRTTLNAQAKL